MINFSADDYKRLRETYRRWWSGSLDRPIVPIVTSGHPSGRRMSEYPGLCFETAWDFSIAPDQLVDAHDWQLSTLRWHGDAFPVFQTMAFGPGTMAAFLGCRPVGAKDTVWFEAPRKNIPIGEMHFEVDAENPYLRRVINLYDAAMEKWRGSVVIGMVDMGGILDVLSSFRGAENLLMDLYDSPDQVLRCVHELQDCWFKYYDMINSVMGSDAMGYTQWFTLYGEEPGYILQSDFSYMIGPDMFDVFVAPELKSSAERLKNAVYHLDGMGEIPHLESIMKIDAIRGIQWVPGAGAPSEMNWDGLLSRILSSGKKLISLAQKDDGRPIGIAADPGQLYFDERRYDVNDMRSAREYAAMFNIEIR